MQRKVYFHNVKVANIDFTTNPPTVTTETHRVYETDEKRALSKFRKSHPNAHIVECVKSSALFMLDDEIFFKYAKEVAEDTNPDTTNADDTANE